MRTCDLVDQRGGGRLVCRGRRQVGHGRVARWTGVMRRMMMVMVVSGGKVVGVRRVAGVELRRAVCSRTSQQAVAVKRFRRQTASQAGKTASEGCYQFRCLV